MSQFITVEEQAKRLNLQPSTVRRWARRGVIPRLQLSQKVIRFDPDAVEQALRDWAAKNNTIVQEAST